MNNSTLWLYFQDTACTKDMLHPWLGSLEQAQPVHQTSTLWMSNTVPELSL